MRFIVCYLILAYGKIALLYQIASLKAALAKKELEPDSIHQKTPDTPCNRQLPSFQSNIQGKDMLMGSKNQRKPMEEVGNIEVKYQLLAFHQLDKCG